MAEQEESFGDAASAWTCPVHPEIRSDGPGFFPICGMLGKGNGAQGRDRTADTAIFNRMLYQLSYLGISGATGWSAGKAAS